MRRAVLLLAATLALPSAGCMMKPRHLVFPQGVMFTGWYVPNFEICNWDRDPNNPQPCPLVVHLSAGDLTDRELSDSAALKRAGWKEESNGNLILRADKGLVCCSYQGGVLTGVSVSALSSGDVIAFSVGGRRLVLPATDEAVAAVLGPPLRRD